jgi:hypothetical protein
MARKDLLTRLADAGEDAITRLAGSPGTDRMVGVANTMRARVDELQRRVRGLDDLERRVAELERRLDEAEASPRAAKKTPARRASARKPKSGEKAASKTKEKPAETDTAATRTTRSGSAAEPVGPATQGASQAGNPDDD